VNYDKVHGKFLADTAEQLFNRNIIKFTSFLETPYIYRQVAINQAPSAISTCSITRHH